MCCSVLQCVAVAVCCSGKRESSDPQSSPRCATRTHLFTILPTATYYNILRHTTTYCNILQHTATYCNTSYVQHVHTCLLSRLLQQMCNAYTYLYDRAYMCNVRIIYHRHLAYIHNTHVLSLSCLCMQHTHTGKRESVDAYICTNPCLYFTCLTWPIFELTPCRWGNWKCIPNSNMRHVIVYPRVYQWRRIFFKSKAVSCKVDRNTKTVILRFFDRTGVILETPELFTKAYFTHNPIYTYLPLFINSWIMQGHWDSDRFHFGDGRICAIFPPLLRFVCKRTDLPLFLLHLRTAFFEAHLLSP